MPDGEFQLSTPRLVLRDFIVTDWSVIYALSREPNVIRYQSWLRLSSEEAARQWVKNAIDHNQYVPRAAYNLAIVPQHTMQAIGWIGWGQASAKTKGDYDFGYALLPCAWNQGYMTEALQAAMTFMFEALDAQEICGECAESNYGSARVMEKSGLHLVTQWYERDDETGRSEKHSRYSRRNYNNSME